MHAAVKPQDSSVPTPLLAHLPARIPALDGVRALAILLVVAYHFRVIPAGSGVVAHAVLNFEASGWCGVDLFFVLSGFLITGILYDTKGRPRYFRTFYLRRALRIFPLYYVMLAFLFVLLPVLLPPGSPWRSFDWRQHWYWTYLANADVTVHGWPMAIGHFWSLALEEQFYLVWPLAVLVLNRRRLLKLCAGVVLLAPLVRLILRDTLGPVSAYVLMPSRADALALGAAVALMARAPHGLRSIVPASRVVALISAVALTVLFLAKGGLDYADLLVNIGGFTLLGALFASTLVLLLAAPEWARVRGVLSGRGPALLGRYSYAIYIFHLPICVLLHDRVRDAGLLAAPRIFGSAIAFQLVYTSVGLGVSVLLAAISWRVLEERMLRLKPGHGAEPALPSAASAA